MLASVNIKLEMNFCILALPKTILYRFIALKILMIIRTNFIFKYLKACPLHAYSELLYAPIKSRSLYIYFTIK